MKKTKIVCTMGPGCDDKAIMKKLVESGMDIARFNFSHGTYEEQKGRMDQLKAIREEAKKPIAILLDTKGPEIRTGVLKDGKKITLTEGSTFALTTTEMEGTEEKVSITYDGLVNDVEAGKRILIDDGLIELVVESKTETDIVCKVKNGGELGERKGVNVPNVPVRLPAITEKDKEDIKFGAEQDVDFIAASFVRNAECILEIKAFLRECNAPLIPIIAKIENAEGIENIDEIIRAADGIMVARGDLGVEIPPEEVPYLQKMIIKKCNDNFKPVITATQMLDSMIRNPRPTRAEVGDVANAVYDGTDAVMLSGETASGKYPTEALRMMVHIVKDTESHLDYDMLLEQAGSHKTNSISSAIGYSSVAAADNLNAKCIITPSVSGATARVVSKFKPRATLIGVSPNERTLRRMQIFWGVIPLKSIEFDTTEDICSAAVELVSVKQYAEIGDIVVLTAGIPSPNVKKAKQGVSNMMRIAVVEEE
ncbi:pyruvate kinase [Hespellia stercorisuis]|uniref:Pyruvate kinase n=1 Tax=Hespellia stercorisuis DSM 15480 TaxID=1121950 RepID=A0A1M6NSH9_9FIRM|nr:pyruvate kinase [Hespellia stercorisuis]SHJ98532.1 pyruvate kinase [Hespellia stercorisuis DSM 15480]